MGIGQEFSNFVTPIPLTNIERLVEQTEQYERLGLPAKSRIMTASCVYNAQGRIIGYEETELLLGATPNAFEHKYLHLRGSLDYVQMRKLFVDPEYRGKGISTSLLTRSLRRAHSLSRDWCTDVRSSDRRMIVILEENNLRLSKTWRAPNGTTMYRFKWDYD